MGVDVTFLAEGDGKSIQVMPCDGVVRSADGWRQERPAGVHLARISNFAFTVFKSQRRRHSSLV